MNNINFHSYVINIHSFGLKLVCDLHLWFRNWDLNLCSWKFGRKKKRKENYLFCFKMKDARWFVYPWIMDRNDNIGGGDSTCGNGDYKRQTKSNLVHNLTHKARVNTSHFVGPQDCFFILLVILGINWSWICECLKNFAKKSYMQERKRKWHVLMHMKKCK